MAAEGPLLHRRRLGVELRRLRNARTLDEVAEATMISTSKLSRLENGQGVPQPRDIRDLIAYYELDGSVAERLRRWASAGRRQAWWKQYSDVVSQSFDAYLDFESGASTIRTFVPSWVPGILQTDAYATSILRGIPPAKTDEQVRRLVEIRQQRRKLLFEDGPATRLMVVVDEAALRRVVGSTTLMVEQLETLRTWSRLRTVALQVLPFEAGVHPGLMGSFTILQFADDIDRDIVNIEMHAGDRYLEEQSSVLEYLRMFDAISHQALDYDATRDFLADVVANLPPEKDSDHE